MDHVKVKVGDVFREMDHRMEGRMVKVVAVFEPGAYYIDTAYVACVSRAKITVISLNRLLDGSRFQFVPAAIAHASHG